MFEAEEFVGAIGCTIHAEINFFLRADFFYDLVHSGKVSQFGSHIRGSWDGDNQGLALIID